MITTFKTPTILIVDDDEEDYFLIKKALSQVEIPHLISYARNGEELMDYLSRQVSSSPTLSSTGYPDLIFLDLNMPRKHGREVLRDLKTDPALRHIPVVILTTSITPIDIYSSYELGANSFIVKPSLFATLVQLMKDIVQYWFTNVELPYGRR